MQAPCMHSQAHPFDQGCSTRLPTLPLLLQPTLGDGCCQVRGTTSVYVLLTAHTLYIIVIEHCEHLTPCCACACRQLQCSRPSTVTAHVITQPCVTENSASFTALYSCDETCHSLDKPAVSPPIPPLPSLSISLSLSLFLPLARSTHP